MRANSLVALLASIVLLSYSTSSNSQQEGYIGFNTYWQEFDAKPMQYRYPDSMTVSEMLNFMLRGQENRGNIDSAENVDWSAVRLHDEKIKKDYLKQRNLALKQLWVIIGKKEQTEDIRNAATSLKDVVAYYQPTPSFFVVSKQEELEKLDQEKLLNAIKTSKKLSLNIPKKVQRKPDVSFAEATRSFVNPGVEWLITTTGDFVRIDENAENGQRVQCMSHNVERPVPIEATFQTCDIDVSKLDIKNRFAEIDVDKLKPEKKLVDLNLVLANVLKYGVSPKMKSDEGEQGDG